MKPPFSVWIQKTITGRRTIRALKFWAMALTQNGVKNFTVHIFGSRESQIAGSLLQDRY